MRMKKVIFLLIPLVLLYLTSETILSAINFSPFVPLPDITPPVEKSKISPWGDTRIVKERIYLGAPVMYEVQEGGFVTAEGFSFRAFLPPVEKKSGLKRIVFIGDSLVFGTGIAEYETLPFYLSAYLRYYKPELAVETVNLGVPGADTQTYMQLRDIGARYQPDLIVLGFTMANDGAVSFTQQVQNDIPDTQKTNKKSLWEMLTSLREFRDLILTNSRTFSALYWPIRRFEARARRDLHMQDMYDDEKKWETVKQNLSAFSEYYREKGIPIVFVIYPYKFANKNLGLNSVKNYRYTRYHQKLVEHAESVGFTVIDFLNYFRKENILSFDNYIIDGDGHPNGAFNAFVARNFARDLLDQSLF
jgi:hypothetical protein